MTTYLHYLWHLIEEVWKEDRFMVIIPITIAIGIGIIVFGGYLLSVGQLWAGIVLILGGYLTIFWLFWLPQLVERINHSYKNYKEWKLSVSTKRKNGEGEE